MKLNLKKIGAIVAGATILASSVAFAGVMYGNTVLVNDNGQPLAKVIVGEKAAASDGVGAAKIVAKLANNAYAAKTLKASATATCTGGAGTGTCDVSQETTTLEVTIPGLGTGVHDFGLLIADFMDKEVQNRVNTDVWDDLSDLRAADANLFADQDDDLFLSGVDGTDGDFYKIYGDNFVRFAKTSVLTGTGRGGNWDQVQYAWFVGDSAMDDDKNNVVNVEIFGGGYSLVFGPSDYGLPLCPGDEKKPYLTCPSSSLIEAYRMQIDFLGDKWVISEVDIPEQSSQITAKSDEKVYGLNGALVKLAKEATYGIIDVGDCLTWEAKGVKVCLDDISTEECYGNLPCKPAIVSFTDLNGKIITTPQGDPVKDKIGQGQTRKIYVPGYGDISVHVYQTAPGYGLLAKWAEMAIYADEIELEHNKKFADLDDTDWKSYLGFTAKGGFNGTGIDPKLTTHLREILLYNDEDYDSDEALGEGDAYPVISPSQYTAYELVYLGLSKPDTDEMKFTIGSDKKFNPVYDTDADEYCWINVTQGYVKVQTNNNEMKMSGPSKSGTKLYVILESGPDTNCTTTVDAGDIILEDKNGDLWFYHDYGSPIEFKFGEGQLFVNDDTENVTFSYAEKTGDYGTDELYDAVSFKAGIDLSVKKFYTDDPSGSDDEVLFTTGDTFSGAVNGNINFDNKLGWANGTSYETPFITLRGTDVTGSGDKRNLKIPKAVKKVLLRFQPTAKAGTKPDTFTCERIPEGGTCKVGDVTILVKSIDEVVAPCSVSGGACVVESVNAQIVDENNQAMGAEVTASVPYTLTSNLMYLDTEATGLGTGVVITVGGQAVNTVTAAALEEAGMTIDSTNNVVVKEVGNKIIVAGYTAEDTLAAVDQFLAGVKRQ